MRHRPLLAGAAALTLVLTLAACSDDGDDDSSTDTTEAVSDDTGAETTEAETDDTVSETTLAETTTTTTTPEQSALTPLLVTAADVGEPFIDTGYQTSEEPGPCGVNLDTDHPYDTIVGTVLADEERQLYLQHEIRTYADEATAAGVLAAAQESFSCGAETTTPGLVLGEVTDVTADVGAPAFLVTTTAEVSETFEGGVVVVQVGPALSVYQFQGPGEVEDGPDPLAIVSTNVAALQAELG